MRIITFDKGQKVADVVVADDPLAVTADNVRAKAAAAIAANQTFAATVAARKAAIGDAKTVAQSGVSATITTLPQAQTAIRQIAQMLVGVVAVLDGLSDQAAANAAQTNATIRLLLAQFDAAD